MVMVQTTAERMKILIYCQHVVGIGHLCRMLEIIRALSSHEVTLILGGPPVDIVLPEHVRVVQLPGLMMDPEYTRMFPVDPGASLDATRARRKKMLLDLLDEEKPDILLVELYPFGRGGFHFELQPFLQGVKAAGRKRCPVVCSVRDILVEKKNQQEYELKVLKRLAPFDAVLVHGDSNVIPLDATFSRTGDIPVPVRYTGYICERAEEGAREKIRSRLDLSADEKLITVSAGGGSFGYPILEAAIRAHALLQPGHRMHVFTGPYLDEEQFMTLTRLAAPDALIDRFAANFPSRLAASDLSISMGGYNTTMNVVASGTPALIYPYGHDREQGMRANRLAELTGLVVLTDEDLDPVRLAEKITSMFDREVTFHQVMLDGAKRTARLLEEMVR